MNIESKNEELSHHCNKGEVICTPTMPTNTKEGGKGLGQDCE